MDKEGDSLGYFKYLHVTYNGQRRYTYKLSLSSSDKPDNVQLTSSARNNTACKGEVISFNCSADANPAVTYQLFENETAILTRNAAGMWSKTLENEGVFVYKCVAHNKPGSMYSTNVMLTVNGNFFEFYHF